MQNDVNLTSPPLAARCTGTDANGVAFSSHFLNSPFRVDDSIAPSDTTCPAPGVSGPQRGREGIRPARRLHARSRASLLPGAVSARRRPAESLRDRLGRGRAYETRRLPIDRYLHERGHPKYVISDRFFQAAFGGSFLNHQWLIAAASPVFKNARSDGSADDLHSRVDANGMPTS